MLKFSTDSNLWNITCCNALLTVSISITCEHGLLLKLVTLFYPLVSMVYCLSL